MAYFLSVLALTEVLVLLIYVSTSRQFHAVTDDSGPISNSSQVGETSFTTNNSHSREFLSLISRFNKVMKESDRPCLT